MKPLIAISVTTYNHEKFIGKTIENLISQKTDFSFKIFITDDCSTDNTASICNDYQNKYPDLINFETFEKNIGVIPNWMNNYQKCIASGAKYIANCDGDDYWTDINKIQKQVEFLNQHEDYGLIFSDTYLIDFDNSELELSPYFADRKKMYKSGDIFWDLLKGNFINNSSICLRTKCIEKVYPQEEKDRNKRWYILDYWLWLFIAKDYQVKFIDEKLSAYRTHPSNVSGGGSPGFISDRRGDIMLDIISALNKSKIGTKENKALISKILISISINTKTSLSNKLKSVFYLLKFPPSAKTIMDGFKKYKNNRKQNQ